MTCPSNYAGGCGSAIDLRDGGTTINFDWPSTFGMPKCITVSANQAISFNGVSTFHTLAQDCGPALPIMGVKTAPFTQAFTLLGMYGMHCTNHGTDAGMGMGLAVQVMP